MSEILKNKLFKILVYLFPSSLIVFFVSINVHEPHHFLYDADWGTQLAYADPILSGRHPFIDYLGGAGGPFFFYLTALGQYLSGGRIIGEIILCILAHSIGYFFLWRLLIHLCKNYALSIAALLWALMLMPKMYKYGITLGPSVLLYVFYRYLSNSSKRNLIYLALAAALNIYLRIDFGAHAFLGAICCIAIKQASERKFVLLEFFYFLLYYFSLAIPYLVFLKYLGGNVFEAFFDAYTALTTAGGGLALSAPLVNLENGLLERNNLFAYYFWTCAVFPFLALLYGWLFYKKTYRNEALFIICLGLYTLQFFMQTSHRADITHLIQIQHVYIAGICLFLLGPLEQKFIKRAIFVSYAAIFLFLGTSFFEIRNPHPISERIKRIRHVKLYSMSRTDFRNELIKRLPSEQYQWRLQMLAYVNEHTSIDEKVLFIPFKPHNYYLSERQFALKFPSMIPDFRMSEIEQLELIELLKKQNIRYIIDFPGFQYDNDPKRAARSFAKVLMDYIYKNYQEVEKFKYAVILKKSS